MRAASPRSADRRLPVIGEAWRLYGRRPFRISAAFACYLAVVGLVSAATGAVGRAGAFGWPGSVVAHIVDIVVGIAAMAGLMRFALACLRERPDPPLDLLVPDRRLLEESFKGSVVQGAAFVALGTAAGLSALLVAVGMTAVRSVPGAGWAMTMAGSALLALALATICRLAFSWMLWQPLLAATGKGYGRALAQSNALVWTMPGKVALLTLRLALLNLAGALCLGIGLLVTGPVSLLALYCACRRLVLVRKADAAAPARPVWRLGPASFVGLGLAGAAMGALLAAGSDTLQRRLSAQTDSLTSELTGDGFVETDATIALAAGSRYIPMEQIGRLSDAAFRSTGTGFFVNGDGDMLSNRHVVEKCRKVITRVGRYVVPVGVVDLDEKSDLALLKVPVQRSHHVLLPVSREYRIGQEMLVFGWGSPAERLGVRLSSAGQLQSGLVNATRGLDDDEQYFQISALLNPGNSGGAIVDRFGLLAGVATQSLARIGNPGIGFGLKLGPVLEFLRSRGVPVAVYRPGPEVPPETVGEMVSQASRKLYCLR